jgi:REP element-mobilizing transposase RayT
MFTRGRRIAFRNRAEYAWAWKTLRRNFKSVLACVLMPDHIHLAIESPDIELSQRKLAACLAAFARVHHHSPIWEKIEPPAPIENDLHLLRQVRYIHLNPCRAKLVPDPLEWEWSTHLEVVGASVPAWMNSEAIRHATEFVITRSRKPWRERFHEYVSGDPSVAIASTPYPRVQDRLIASYQELERGTLIATHADRLRQRRGLNLRGIFVRLALDLGFPSCGSLAEFLGVETRTVVGLRGADLKPTESAALAAARLVLSDERLRRAFR